MGTPDPIKPKNEIRLGGVRFNTNETESYGKIKNTESFYINFLDGTKVTYSNQHKGFVNSIMQDITDPYNNNKDPYASGEHIENIDGAHVTIGQEDHVLISNCNDIEIIGGNEGDLINIYDSKDIRVKSLEGDDNVNLHNSTNFVIDAGEGKDEVKVIINDRSNKRSFGLSEEEIIDARDLPLPEGKVHLSEDDKLTISKGTSTYDEPTDDTERSVNVYSKAEVVGKGVHSIKQTPEGAFETEVTTRVYNLKDDELISEETVKIKAWEDLPIE